MTPNEYQKMALRTARTKNSPKDQLLECALGIAGEGGEVADVIKKVVFHDHPLNREELIEELGDCAWYLAVAADAIGANLEYVLEKNVAKLRKRYPDGFDPERSIHREV